MNTQYVKEVFEACTAGFGVFMALFFTGWSLSLWQPMVGGVIIGVGIVLGVLWGRYVYVEHHSYEGGEHMDYRDQY